MPKQKRSLVAFALIIAACGGTGSSKSGGSSNQATTSTTPTAAPAGGAATRTGSTTLQLVETTLGKVVADRNGKVLYEYVPDAGSTVSNVPPGLLGAWPPLKAAGVPTLGPGLTAKSSTATQPNGEKWVVYNGHLLYTHAGDPGPGMATGNAVDNVWYPLTAAGEPVQS